MKQIKIEYNPHLCFTSLQCHMSCDLEYFNVKSVGYNNFIGTSSLISMSKYKIF